MKTIKQTYKIKAPAKKVWQALVSPKEIKGWGAGPAKMSGRAGAKFSLWGGSIFGKNILVVPGKKIVQEWFGGQWAKPSIVEILLNANNGITEIKLKHKGMPAKEVKDLSQGWKDYYFGPMKEYLENK